MIDTVNQEALATWLCDRIGLEATKHLRCIGQVRDGEIKGVVGYDNYNGASIQMHAAGDGYWLTKEMLHAVFDYPFNVCKANILIGLIPSGNTDALKFNEHIGFKTKTRLYGAHPDGALVLMTMHRDKCRYLRTQDGKEK